jgi:membrane-associated phospholipid phosphatase
MPPHVFRQSKNPPIARQWSVRDKGMLGLALTCGVVFAVLTAQAAQGEFLVLDAALRASLAEWQHPLLMSAMRSATMLGGGPWLLPLIGLVMFLVWEEYGAHVLLVWSGHTLASTVVFHSIRFMVGRPRPVSPASGYPSGHTVAAIAFYGLLIYLLWPRQCSWRVCRIAICGLLLLIIIGVGFSRILLEKHWLSDVLGAYMAGGFYLTTCVWLFERPQARQKS